MIILIELRKWFWNVTSQTKNDDASVEICSPCDRYCAAVAGKSIIRANYMRIEIRRIRYFVRAG